MKREELDALGLNEEQKKQIMRMNGDDIENAKREGVAEKQRANDLQAQLTQLTNDLENARKNAGDIDALQRQLQAAQDALAANRKAAAVRDALDGYKPRDVQLLARLIDHDKITVNADGTLIGLQEQVEPLRQKSGYLFSDAPDPRGGTDSTGGTNETFDFNAFLRGEK